MVTIAEMQRILIVDDDQQTVRLISASLEEAGFAVRTAPDGETAMHLIHRESPDLIVLDVSLPGREGMEITHWLRADPLAAGIPILMLTPRLEDVDNVVNLEMAADDYLMEPFNPREVPARVRASLRRAAGNLLPSTSVLQADGLRLDIGHHLVAVRGQPVTLTPAEFTLLQTLMENPDHAFTRTELIEKAFGYTYAGLERTLDSHIKNLRKKIEPDPAQPRYVETVFGVGYRLRKDLPAEGA